MRTDKTIFVNESVTNIIVHPLISVIRKIITLNESVNTNFNKLVVVCYWDLGDADLCLMYSLKTL